MGKYRTKAFQADLCIFIFRHSQAYSEIIQRYYIFMVLRTLCNHGIFRTPVYLETWHIQNCSRFRMLTYSSFGIFRILMYSEPCYIHSEPCETSTMEHFRKQLTANIIFAITAFHVVEFMKKYMIFFNRGLISNLYSVVFIRYKRIWGLRG